MSDTLKSDNIKVYFYGEQKNTDKFREFCDKYDIMYEFKKGAATLLFFVSGEMQEVTLDHGNTLLYWPETHKFKIIGALNGA